ncbi:MAG: ATP-binding protein [Crenarchaeota archaeon]|nr:ATP-binding protein [Thermoproteota archaeon]
MHIVINNYKSIESIDLELSRVTIFLGPPAAGKSNILEAIALAGYPWRLSQQDIYVEPRNIRPTLQSILRTSPQLSDIDVIFPRFDFTRVFEIEISNDNYLIKFSIKYENNKLRVDYCNHDITDVFLECLTHIPDRWITDTLPVFESRLYSFDRYQYVKERCFLNRSMYPVKLDILLENGENLVDIVSRFSEILVRVNNFLEEYLETKVDIRYLNLERRLAVFDYYVEVSPSLLADGIWRILYYVSALYSAKRYAYKYNLKNRLLILFEEPDAHTFPYVVHLLTELINEVSEYVYIIMTTHNGVLASMIATKVPSTAVYYVYRGRDGWTHAIKINIEKLAEHVLELSDLLLMSPSEILEKFSEKY